FGSDPSGSGDWWFALVVENAGATDQVLEIPLDVYALDAAGNRLAMQKAPASLFPGSNIVAGTFADLTSDDVYAIDALLKTEPKVIPFDAHAEPLKIGGVITSHDIPAGAAHVAGMVRNPRPDAVENVRVT